MSVIVHVTESLIGPLDGPAHEPGEVDVTITYRGVRYHGVGMLVDLTIDFETVDWAGSIGEVHAVPTGAKTLTLRIVRADIDISQGG